MQPDKLPKRERRRRERWAREGYGFSPQCYLCQECPATTDDHVPPRGLFATTRGSDAQLLPSCDSCNGLLNEDEEYFRNVLASAGTNDEATHALQAVLRSFQGSSSLYPFDNRSQLYKNVRIVDLYSRGGIWKGRLPTFDVSQERLQRVVTKIVRGLYYYHQKSPLPSVCDIIVIPFFPPNTGPLVEWLTSLKDMRAAFRGEFPRVLSYIAWSVREYPDSSMWGLLFYRTLGFGVMVGSPSIRQAKREHQEGLVVRPSTEPSNGSRSNDAHE
jgi:hypothetical protein